MGGLALAFLNSILSSGKPSVSVSLLDKGNLRSASKLLGVEFQRPELLSFALTHPSAIPNTDKDRPEGPSMFQRLEFLGDRVLGLIIAERLLVYFPDETEGDLARRYGVLVSTGTLADIIREMGLASYVKFGASERSQNGYYNSSCLADICEAVIGAIYLDSGLEIARGLVEREWVDMIQKQDEPPRDPKTALQEWSQSLGLGLPQYEVRSQGGPDHSPIFEILVRIGEGLSVLGKGKSKRVAERLAAENMLVKLKEEGKLATLSKS